ncbi:MAG: terpene cyclase/mutase family protein [Pirellulaceae bacterium]|nr:terpene cyclase/mutase family protein [Pirellulaceae bacterium]
MTRPESRVPPIFPSDGPPPPAEALSSESAHVVSHAATPSIVVSSPSSKGNSAKQPAPGGPAKSVAERSDHPALSEQAIETAPPWLLSAAFHMGLLILLGLLLLPSRPDPRIALEASTYAEQLGDQLDFESPLPGEQHDDAEAPVVTPDHLPEVADPFAAPRPTEIFPDGRMAVGSIDTAQIGMALLGRDEGMKRSLLGKYGGTDTTEAAVQAGLRWLARNQQRDGSWSLTGPYSHGATIQNQSAATAMALLAFLGNGHTHRRNTEYTQNVQRGLNWMLGKQDDDGCFFQDGGWNHRSYTHAQCTIVLCELLAMSPRDESLREPARRAVQYLLDSQSDEGGWKYRPRYMSDVSVTGWVVMALQSARMAGIEIPSENLRRVEKYLDDVGIEEGSRYPYERGHQATPAMTAEALLCRQYLGWKRDDKRLLRGADWLVMPENLIDYRANHNVYYWYYAAQVMHHLEGEHWQRWNRVMRQEVPTHQVKQGKEAGSWDPSPQSLHDTSGGRLYVTCLSIYMLEVYYRHMPLYSRIDAR